MPEAREMHRLGKIWDMYAMYLIYGVIFVWGRNIQLLSGCVCGKNLIPDGKCVCILRMTSVVEITIKITQLKSSGKTSSKSYSTFLTSWITSTGIHKMNLTGLFQNSKVHILCRPN